MIRRSEEDAAVSFADFLRSNGKSCEWIPGGDPPDCDFTVEGEKWAVEITTIYQQVADERGGYLSERGYFAGLKRMCNAIREKLPDQLEIDFRVSVRGLVKSAEREEIVKRAAEFISDGRRGRIRLGRESQVTVESCEGEAQGQGRVFFSITMPTDLKSGDGESLHTDFRRAIEFATEERIREKYRRLETLQGWDRKVLFLWSEFMFPIVNHVRTHVRGRNDMGNVIDAVVLFEAGGIHVISDDNGCLT